VLRVKPAVRPRSPRLSQRRAAVIEATGFADFGKGWGGPRFLEGDGKAPRVV
jgi:hypothetical protein